MEVRLRWGGRPKASWNALVICAAESAVGSGADAVGEEIGLLKDEGGVEEGEGLEGSGGHFTAGGALGVFGFVEGGHQVVVDVAGGLLVDGAAQGFGALVGERFVDADVDDFVFVEMEAGAADGGRGEVELSAGEEDGVADGLGLEAAEGHAPEEAVAGVGRKAGREGSVVGATGLAVGLREDDLAVQAFDPPAAFDEIGGEPVEQFGVAGGFAVGAEVAGGADEASAEMVLPDAVDQDAGRERVVFVADPVGQGEAAGGLRRRLERGEDRRGDWGCA